MDADGNMLIADYDNERFRKVNTNGIITTSTGTGTATIDGDGGFPIFSTSQRPSAMALDSHRNLWLADRHNRRIRVINAG